MKKLSAISAIGLAALLPLALPTQAQTNASSVFSTVWKWGETLILNNPTNRWDLSAGTVMNLDRDLSGSTAQRFGGMLRGGWWIPGTSGSLGAALDFSYMPATKDLTCATIGFTGRGTVNLASGATLTLYAAVGPGINISGMDEVSTLMFAADGGGRLHINRVPVDFSAELQHLAYESGASPRNRLALFVSRSF